MAVVCGLFYLKKPHWYFLAAGAIAALMGLLNLAQRLVKK
jgi:hypothetical protein